VPGRTDDQPLNDADVLAEMKQVAPDDMWFPPGTQYRYSNTGYSLLASVVEAIARKPFAHFMREEIIDKLGMSHSDQLDVYHPRPLPTRAYGYSLESGAWRLDDWDNTFGVLGDGMMYASAEDLALWDRALYPDSPSRLVGPDTLREAFTSHTPTGDEPYGFGWALATWHGLVNVGHGGATRGFRSRIERFPQVRVTFAVLRNAEDHDDDARNALWTTKLAKVVELYLFPYEAEWGELVGATAETVTLDSNRNGLADASDPVFTFAPNGALLSPREGIDETRVWRLECACRVARGRLRQDLRTD
jgi:CubicO group peptidase (beta-lactamase class C family)